MFYDETPKTSEKSKITRNSRPAPPFVYISLHHRATAQFYSRIWANTTNPSREQPWEVYLRIEDLWTDLERPPMSKRFAVVPCCVYSFRKDRNGRYNRRWRRLGVGWTRHIRDKAPRRIGSISTQIYIYRSRVDLPLFVVGVYVCMFLFCVTCYKQFVAHRDKTSWRIGSISIHI